MQQAGEHARIRFMHASPDAPPLDFYVDGMTAAAGLAYGRISEYVALAPERYCVLAFLGGSDDPADEILFAKLEKLRPLEEYTVLAVERLHDISVMSLYDTTGAPGPGHAKVRVVHASPDAPALDVGMTGTPALYRLLAFRDATPYQEVEAGTVTLEMRRSGHAEIIARLPEVTLAPAYLYTFVALGLLDDVPPFAIVPIAEAARECAPVR